MGKSNHLVVSAVSDRMQFSTNFHTARRHANCHTDGDRHAIAYGNTNSNMDANGCLDTNANANLNADSFSNGVAHTYACVYIHPDA